MLAIAKNTVDGIMSKYRQIKRLESDLEGMCAKVLSYELKQYLLNLSHQTEGGKMFCVILIIPDIALLFFCYNA